MPTRRGWSKHRPALPLYDAADVDQTLPLFREVAFGDPFALGPTIGGRLQPAGHILGSSVAVMELRGCRVVFSGDLGRPGHPLLDSPAPPPAADAVVLESTYGDRLHEPPDPAVLADAVRRTVERGGTVLIPAFAVDRTELVLLALHSLTEAGEIPRLPVFVDSPMALAGLEVYTRALRSGSPDLREDRMQALGALRQMDLRPVHEARESEALNQPAFPCIIVSASGMGTGGRVVHHLRHQLPDPRNCVVLTGYQAQGTRGRLLLDGARHVKMHGRYVPVRAEVVHVPDFSVHADADELVAWVAASPSLPRTVYVVHGEPRAADALARRIETELGVCAVVPRLGERVRLD